MSNKMFRCLLNYESRILFLKRLDSILQDLQLMNNADTALSGNIIARGIQGKESFAQLDKPEKTRNNSQSLNGSLYRYN